MPTREEIKSALQRTREVSASASEQRLRSAPSASVSVHNSPSARRAAPAWAGALWRDMHDPAAEHAAAVAALVDSVIS